MDSIGHFANIPCIAGHILYRIGISIRLWYLVSTRIIQILVKLGIIPLILQVFFSQAGLRPHGQCDTFSERYFVFCLRVFHGKGIYIKFKINCFRISITVTYKASIVVCCLLNIFCTIRVGFGRSDILPAVLRFQLPLIGEGNSTICLSCYG